MSEKVIEPDKLLDAFGLVIAYLCPGFLTIWAMHVVAPGFVIPGADLTGGFVFLFLAAISVGVLLSGVRTMIVNEVLFARDEKNGKLPAAVDSDAARKDPGTEAAYRDIRAMFFPYFQFFSHMFVAAPFVFLAWVLHARPDLVSMSIGFGGLVVAEWVLYRNARFSMCRYRQRLARLFAEPAAGEPLERGLKNVERR